MGFQISGKDTNGIYSWYDVCENCDSQLTLYVANWSVVLIAAIFLSILWLLHATILWALAKGYPSKGVSLLLPIFWAVSIIFIIAPVIAFPTFLPSCKSDDDSQCRRFLDAFINSDDAFSPCESFVGEMDWSRGGNEGFVFWGPSSGYVFLVIALILSVFFGIISTALTRMIRRAVPEEPEYGMIPMDDAMGLQMNDSAYITPGL